MIMNKDSSMNKDASEGREADICQIGLQIVCFRLSAGMVQVLCRLFVFRDPYLDFSSISMLFPLKFRRTY